VIADANAGGRVQASQSGRVEPGPQGLPVRSARRWPRARCWPGCARRQQASSAATSRPCWRSSPPRSPSPRARLRRYAQLEGADRRARTRSGAHRTGRAAKTQAPPSRASLDAAGALRAPVTGVISVAGVVAGQVVEARRCCSRWSIPRVWRSRRWPMTRPRRQGIAGPVLRTARWRRRAAEFRRRRAAACANRPCRCCSASFHWARVPVWRSASRSR
jgi:hypothetical protein